MQRVILVGCGFMGKMHGTVYGVLPNAEMVAAVDKDPVRLKDHCDQFGCRGYEDLEKAIEKEEADVVDICLPTDLHFPVTCLAAGYGKNVFCEKPMARTATEAARMAELCKEKGVRLMIGHCIRFWPEYALLKQIVDDRRFGELLSINLTRFGSFPTWSAEQWLESEKRAGGGVLDMHIHDTDFAHYILGTPDEMFSVGNIDGHGPAYVFTTMRFGNKIAHIEGGWNLPAKTPFKMAFRAIFERGAAIMDGGPMTIYEEGKDLVVPDFPKMEAKGGGNISDMGGYYVELKYFIDRLESGEPFEVVTPETSLQSLETTLAEIEQIKARA